MVTAITRQNNAKKSGCSSATRCVFISACLALFLFMMPGGAPVQDDNLRSGQTEHTKATAPSRPRIDTVQDNTDDDETYAEIESEVDNARGDIEAAEKKELEKTEYGLMAAIETTGNYMQSAITKLLAGTGVSEGEIDNMVSDAKHALSAETRTELETEANEWAEQEENTIEDFALDEGDAGIDIETIRSGISDREENAINGITQRIDEKADEMQKRMREKAEQIEIEILEKRLEERLGKKVKLVVQDHEISDVDHILDGLHTLTRSEGNGAVGAGHNNYQNPPGDDPVASNEGHNTDDGGFDDDNA